MIELYDVPEGRAVLTGNGCKDLFRPVGVNRAALLQEYDNLPASPGRSTLFLGRQQGITCYEEITRRKIRR